MQVGVEVHIFGELGPVRCLVLFAELVELVLQDYLKYVSRCSSGIVSGRSTLVDIGLALFSELLKLRVCGVCRDHEVDELRVTGH